MTTQLFHPELKDVELGRVLTALTDPLRRRVVTDLIREEDGVERTCMSFGLPVGKSTLTHHFRILREAGLIHQVDRGNSRKVQLRRAEFETRFPGILALLLAEAPGETVPDTQTVA
ncbi:ArsR/SmtB family transcription factor [Streptomyces decoyicus]|uniref:ArsR/SmtB family transcription factor n=1 Tax=Streptomyces decoyicus TaxID=249567 RepID=UPI003657ECFD